MAKLTILIVIVATAAVAVNFAILRAAGTDESLGSLSPVVGGLTPPPEGARKPVTDLPGKHAPVAPARERSSRARASAVTRQVPAGGSATPLDPAPTTAPPSTPTAASPMPAARTPAAQPPPRRPTPTPRPAPQPAPSSTPSGEAAREAAKQTAEREREAAKQLAEEQREAAKNASEQVDEDPKDSE